MQRSGASPVADYGILEARILEDLMEKPTPPGDYDCCESGCEPCIWDSYYAELAEYQAWERAEKAKKTGTTEQPSTQA